MIPPSLCLNKASRGWSLFFFLSIHFLPHIFCFCFHTDGPLGGAESVYFEVSARLVWPASQILMRFSQTTFGD